MRRINHPFFQRKSVNIDTTNRCALECPKCMRQLHYRNFNKPVPGKDLTIEDWQKITDYMGSIGFEGTYSDPVHHPRFLEMLKDCYEKNIEVSIQNASSVKNLDWYIKAFKANPNAQWIFSIDGLPEDSNIYRVNQDGVKLFNIMKESIKYLNFTPTWQYIVFKYNENDIERATDLAKEIGVNFYKLISSRWTNAEDPLLPINIKNRTLN